MFMACVIELCEAQVASGKTEQVQRQIEALMQLLLHGISADAGGTEGT
jgi:hypothetical protein